MDRETKERIHPTPADTPARATKETKFHSSLMADMRRKPRIRSYSSTIINLGALIALLAVVFALQHVSNKTSDDRRGESEPVEAMATPDTPPATEQATKIPPTVKTSSLTPEKEPAVVDLETLETCRRLQATGQLKAASDRDTTAASRKSRQTKRARTYNTPMARYDTGWEDRIRSASLVDMLDGGSARYTSPAYTSIPSAASAGYGDSTPTYYQGDLDSESARQQYLSTNVQPRESYPARKMEYEPTPYAPALSSPESHDMQMAQTSRGYRKPLWEANVGR